MNAPAHWKQGTFVDYDDSEMTANGVIDPNEVSVVLPKPDIVFPSLLEWLTLRQESTPQTLSLAEQFLRKSKTAIGVEQKLFGELAAALAIRGVKPLPEVGAGWRDVALLAMELVTFASTIWRFARLNEGPILMDSAAHFVINKVAIETERTTLITKNRLAVAQLETGAVIWLDMGSQCSSSLPSNEPRMDRKSH